MDWKFICYERYSKFYGRLIKRYEELILTTDMGKKMEEIGDKYGT